MTGSTPKSAGSRCVLWHAKDDAPPADLLTSLHRRQVEICACTSGYGAIAQICLGERANDERTDRVEDREALVLVIVNPPALQNVVPVIDAARRYAGRTACWWYDPGANPRLRAVVDEDIEEWSSARSGPVGRPANGIPGPTPTVVTRPAPDATARPRLKLSGDSENGGSSGHPSKLRSDELGEEGSSGGWSGTGNVAH